MWCHGEMMTWELGDQTQLYPLRCPHSFLILSQWLGQFISAMYIPTHETVVRNHDHLVWNYQLLAKYNVQISGVFGSANKLGQIGNIFHVHDK